jgi:valyl-tRNA synthetase
MLRSSPYVEALARARPFEVRAEDDGSQRPASAAATRAGLTWIDPGDQAATPARPQGQAAELEQRITRLRALLGNRSFVAKAPAEVVHKERLRLSELEEQLRQLTGR